jgi:cell division septation protein DedD
MDEDFNPDDLRPVPYRPDTELMLGPMRLGGLIFALILLCGICYLVGYAVGRRGVHNVPATGPKQSTPVAPAGGSAPKPSASPQGSNNPRGAARDSAPSEEASGSSGSDSTSTVMASTTQPSSAVPPAQVLMVQVAAVSHKEDADVLVGALRKHGYAVNVHRDLADNLLHVRIGPFTSINDANATRQRLLNDGYNASVQP